MFVVGDGSFPGPERTFWCGTFNGTQPITVNLEQLCDGTNDCGNGIDEKTTLCESTFNILIFAYLLTSEMLQFLDNLF